MSTVDLYKKGCFHQVITNAALCLIDLDYICLCLSLVGIGRHKAAVILLRAKAESGLDPLMKICVLSCLYEITGTLEYSLESEYWQSLGDFDDRVFQRLKPIPQCPSNIIQDCTSIFLEKGAFFHPNSYLFTCLSDKLAAIAMAQTKNPGALLLQTIATCGSTAQVAKVLKLEEIKSNFSKTQEIVDTASIDTELQNGILNCLNLAQDFAAIAGYYHLLKESPKALYYCTQAINLINAIRIKYGTPDLKGILDYEKETIVMLASNHLQGVSSEMFVESLLNELMYPGSPKLSGEGRLNPITNSFHQIAQATFLRQSFFFESCGNIYRSTAEQTSFTLSFLNQDRKYKGIIYLRDDMLELTRKYVLSTALQPIDNPFIYLHYDRVIWCLLLSGGIDYRVILLFFTIRNYYHHKVGTSLSENDLENLIVLWPKFIRDSKILQEVYEKCVKLSKLEVEGPDICLPTTLDCDDHVVFLKCFLQDPRTLLFDGLQDINTLNRPSRTNISDAELCYLMQSSQEIAEMWNSTYRKAHGEIPNEIRQVTRFFNL